MPADIELLKRKALQMERALGRVRSRLSPELAEFETDYDAQDIVFRNFQIAVQNCVDMASRLILEKRYPSPNAMAEAFDILGAHRHLDAAPVKILKKLVALRNILVHDYTRLDLKRAHPLIRESLSVLPAFCRKILKS